MENTFTKEFVNERTWKEIIHLLPNPHFLQSNIWAEIKKENGWKPFFLIWKNSSGKIVAGVMILERSIQIFKVFSLRIQYCPKGPLLNWHDSNLVQKVLSDIEDFAKNRKVIFTKIDPDVFIHHYSQIEHITNDLNSSQILKDFLEKEGWLASKEQIQFRNSFYLSLENSEDQLLSKMKQKTRYNIRLSERKEVKVRVGERADFEKLYKLYASTAIRDNFIIRSKEYYLNAWQKFYDEGFCEPLIAEFNGEILAAVIIYFFGDKAYYVYGMSSDKHRNLMATYLLQWKAIQRAKEKNLKIYDFWGAPDEINENDRMWGVYKFKIGFGGELVRTIGAWDFPITRIGYSFYMFVLPKILDVMRKIGFRKIKNQIDS